MNRAARDGRLDLLDAAHALFNLPQIRRVPDADDEA
jgi:glutamyl-tRNA reductase